MSRRQKLPPNVEPDLPPFDPSQASMDNSSAMADPNFVPPMTDEYMDTAPEEVVNDVANQQEVRRAEPVMQPTGSVFGLGFIEQINSLPEAEARKAYDALTPVQKRIYDRAFGYEEVTATKAEQWADEFYKSQDADARMAASPQARAAEEKQLVDREKRMIALDEIKSVRKTITEMVGDGDKIPPHPGFSGSVGLKNYAYAFGVIPEFLGGDRPFSGTAEADFYPYLKQLEGGAFLRAFERIKGGGQITEIEGQKATEAIIRASSSQSEAGFKKSMKDFVDVITAVEARMLETEAARGGGGAAAQRSAAGSPVAASPAAEEAFMHEGYKYRRLPDGSAELVE